MWNAFALPLTLLAFHLLPPRLLRGELMALLVRFRFRDHGQLGVEVGLGGEGSPKLGVEGSCGLGGEGSLGLGVEGSLGVKGLHRDARSRRQR